MPGRKKDLAPTNGPKWVIRRSVPDVRADRTPLLGDPLSLSEGGSSPTSASDAMVMAPVQISVGAK